MKRIICAVVVLIGLAGPAWDQFQLTLRQVRRPESPSVARLFKKYVRISPCPLT